VPFTACAALASASGAEATQSAQLIARRVEARYHSVSTLKARFLERYSEDRRDARVESGTVYFRRPGRMRWEYESPEEKLFVADGKTVWFYVPADRTVSRARTKESSDWRTPLAWLTGKVKLSRLCRRIELVTDPASLAGVPSNHAMLRCLPRGENATQGKRELEPATELSSEPGPFLEVLLEVDPVSGELARVLVRDTGGTQIEYRFANWQQNLPLPEAMFHFRAPPGVAIVDESAMIAAPR